MTNEVAVERIKILKAFTGYDKDNQMVTELHEALDLAINALEQEPCEDCISRKAALEQAMDYGSKTFLIPVNSIKALPPVTPQRPKGKWIEIDVHNFYATLKCSVCDRVIEPYFSFGEYSYEDIKTFYPYCHCGAEMSGGGEDAT